MMNKEELINLSEEILKAIEMNECPLSSICYKCLRLTRLLNDEIGIKLFTAETSGYPKDEETGKIKRDYWNIGYSYAGRGFIETDNVEIQKKIFYDTIYEMEELIETTKIGLSAAKDPNISITSANPYQHVHLPKGNAVERNNYLQGVKKAAARLNKVKGAIYSYILNINGSLKNDEVFMKLLEKNHKNSVKKLTKICPDLITQFDSIYNNIDSGNTVDLDNCVHTCRRILKTLADSLYPIDKNDEIIELEGAKIKLGEEQYINRLLAFISTKSNSKTYSKVVGSSLEDINKKMHSLYEASCKGSHTGLTKQEVERYVLYTYMFLDDIAMLME